MTCNPNTAMMKMNIRVIIETAPPPNRKGMRNGMGNAATNAIRSMRHRTSPIRSS